MYKNVLRKSDCQQYIKYLVFKEKKKKKKKKERKLGTFAHNLHVQNYQCVFDIKNNDNMFLQGIQTLVFTKENFWGLLRISCGL